MSSTKLVEDWNAAHRPGCTVIVTLDSGEERRTRTLSEAELPCGHTPVVWLDGIRGAYALSRVRADTRRAVQFFAAFARFGPNAPYLDEGTPRHVLFPEYLSIERALLDSRPVPTTITRGSALVIALRMRTAMHHPMFRQFDFVADNAGVRMVRRID